MGGFCPLHNSTIGVEMKQNELNPTERLLRNLRLIKAHTDYDMIGIEQVDRKFNKVESVQIFKYTVKMDNTDPENPVIDEIKGDITAGTLLFVDDPFPNSDSVGTGRVAYLVNDKKKNFEGYLSGEPYGRNLEFLAANYGDKLFKVIDPKWEEVVKKRHEAIKKAQSVEKPPHVFDRRYNVKGTVEDRVKVEVEQPKNVQDMIAAFQEERAETAELIKGLKTRLDEKESQPEKKKSKEKSVEKKESPIKSHFGG
jgi:hypothetical protein